MNFKLFMATVATRFIVMQQEKARASCFEDNRVGRDVFTVCGHEPIKEERSQKGGCSKK